MQVFRSFETASIGLPSIESIGGCALSKKNLNELHDGHLYILNAIKNDPEVDQIFVMFSNNTNGINFFYPENGTTIETVWDEAYCLTWAEDNDVDYVFIAPDNIFGDLLDTLDLDDLKQQVETIIINEGYDDLIPSDEKYLARFTFLSQLIQNELGMFLHKTKQYCSWEFTIFNYIKQDFYSKYSDREIVILDPYRRPDSLPHSSRLLNLSQDKIDIFLAVKNEILNTVQSGQDFTAIDLTIILDDKFILTSLWLKVNLYASGKTYIEWHLKDAVDETKNYRFGELI